MSEERSTNEKVEREDGIENIRLGSQQELDEELQDEEVPEWERREPECH